MKTFNFGIGLLIATLFLTGCPGSNNQANVIGGRLSRGNISGGSATMGSAKSYGEITSQAGDSTFRQELINLTSPALPDDGSDQSLGNVSAQSGQATGVRFWGNVRSGATSGIDTTSLMLRLEIYDDKAVQGLRSMIPIQFSSDQPTFVAAGGSVQGSSVYLWFQDIYGTVMMSGTINGQTFTGIIGFSDSATGNSSQQLGNFSVPTCGFFVCN